MKPMPTTFFSRSLYKSKAIVAAVAMLVSFALAVPAYAGEYGKGHRGGGKGSNVGKIIGTIGVITAIGIAASQAKKKKKKKTTSKKRKPKKRVTKRKTTKKKRTVKRTAPAPVPAFVVPRYRDNQILIAFVEGASQADIQAFEAQFGLVQMDSTLIEVIDQQIVRYSYPQNDSPDEVASQIRSNPIVSNTQPNLMYELTGGPGIQYALTKLKVRRAHKISRGGGVVVAVIDSGIDETHPALDGAIVNRFNAADTELQGSDPHGTSVASIISAQEGMTSVAPDAQIVSVRAFSPDSKGQPAVSTSLNLLKSVDWSVKQGARVLNMSFSGPKDELMEKALNAAADLGIVSVAAAGNKGRKAPAAYPAAYDSVIAATATDSKDRLYKHANRGNYVAIAAPGVNVLVASKKKSYGLKSGTSMAAAYISGSVALMLQQSPGLDHAKVVSRLAGSARDLGKKGKDSAYGYGLANTYELINGVSEMSIPQATAQKTAN